MLWNNFAISRKNFQQIEGLQYGTYDVCRHFESKRCGYEICGGAHLMKSATGLKAKVRNISKGDDKVAKALIRIFWMERFLERESM